MHAHTWTGQSTNSPNVLVQEASFTCLHFDAPYLQTLLTEGSLLWEVYLSLISSIKWCAEQREPHVIISIHSSTTEGTPGPVDKTEKLYMPQPSPTHPPKYVACWPLSSALSKAKAPDHWAQCESDRSYSLIEKHSCTVLLFKKLSHTLSPKDCKLRWSQTKLFI